MLKLIKNSWGKDGCRHAFEIVNDRVRWLESTPEALAAEQSTRTERACDWLTAYLREHQPAKATDAYEAGQPVRTPIAHHDGNYYADPDTLAAMEDRGQIAFRYCAPDGAVTPEGNPNGSLANIAGVTNAAKTVLGLMPHPERLSDPQLGGSDGRAMFDGLVEALS